jgi:hypothetical protein
MGSPHSVRLSQQKTRLPAMNFIGSERSVLLTMYWLSVNWKNAFGALAGFRDYGDR